MNSKDVLGVAILVFITIIALIISGVLLGTNNPKQVDTVITVTPAPNPPFFGVVPNPTSTAIPDTYIWNITTQPTKIDWGTLLPSFNYTRTVTIRNVGNTTTQPLNMTNTATVGTVTWDAEGLTIAPFSQLNTNLSLAVSPDAPQGPFNFTITITG